VFGEILFNFHGIFLWKNLNFELKNHKNIFFKNDIMSMQKTSTSMQTLKTCNKIKAFLVY
jgi:hypothetical protein